MAPRVKPDSVTVTEPVVVAAPAVVMTICLLAAETAVAEPVSKAMLVAAAAKVAVPMK